MQIHNKKQLNEQTQKYLDDMLKEVIIQAKTLGIKPSSKIFPGVVVNRRAKRRFGCCKRKNGIEGGFVIELSEYMTDAPEKFIKQTLAHEILHTCKDCYDHSRQWKYFAEGMNRAYGYDIKRVSTYEQMGLKTPEGSNGIGGQKNSEPRYLLVCEDCGLEIRRQKLSQAVRHPELYHCRCGGKLRRER